MSSKTFGGQHLRTIPSGWCGCEVRVRWAKAEVGCCLYPGVFVAESRLDEVGLAMDDCCAEAGEAQSSKFCWGAYCLRECF